MRPATVGASAPTPVPALPWVTLAMAAGAIAIGLWPGASEALQLQREIPFRARGWTWWTAHLAHFGGAHLFWNLAIFVPAGAWAERLEPWRVRIYFFFAAPVVSAVLLALDPALARYAGLSGIAAGLLTLLALVRLGELEAGQRWFWRGVLALVAAKIGVEAFTRAPVLADFAEDEVQPVALAHAVGVACGVAAYVSPWPARRRPWGR